MAHVIIGRFGKDTDVFDEDLEKFEVTEDTFHHFLRKVRSNLDAYR